MTEIIREKILLYYQKEIPYAVEVVVEQFKEEADLIRIKALIIVERDSQKGIIIGYRGQALKKVGAMARKDIEHFFEKKVFLEMFVKVESRKRLAEPGCDVEEFRLSIGLINDFFTSKIKTYGKYCGNRR